MVRKPGEKLKVGIAGCGVVGKRRQAVVETHDDLEIIGLSDRAFGSDGIRDGVAVFSDYRRLLELPLDVLFVCLTNDVAADATMQGLQRGMHVFCEKPPGRNLDEIHRVLMTERRHPGLKLKYGFNHRYHDSVRDALRIVRSGVFGKVINLRGVYGKSQLVTFNQDDWRTKRAVAGGGVLLDQGIHMVDLTRLFAGEFEQVVSMISNDFWGFEVEDNAYAMMKTADGVVAMLHSSATQWRHRFNLEVTMTKGMVTLSGILSGSKSYGAETLTVVWADPERDGGDPKEQVTRYNSDPSWKDEVYEFIESIANDTPIENGSVVEAFKTMELVYRIYCADDAWRERFQLSSKVTRGASHEPTRKEASRHAGDAGPVREEVLPVPK